MKTEWTIQNKLFIMGELFFLSEYFENELINFTIIRHQLDKGPFEKDSYGPK